MPNNSSETTPQANPRDARIKLPILGAFSFLFPTALQSLRIPATGAIASNKWTEAAISAVVDMREINTSTFFGRFFRAIEVSKRTVNPSLEKSLKKAHSLLYSPECRKWRREHWNPSDPDSVLLACDTLFPDNANIDFSGNVTYTQPISIREAREAQEKEGDMTMKIFDTDILWERLAYQKMPDGSYKPVIGKNINYQILNYQDGLAYVGSHHNSGYYDKTAKTILKASNNVGTQFTMSNPFPDSTTKSYKVTGTFGPFDSSNYKWATGENGWASLVDLANGTTVLQTRPNERYMYTCQRGNTTFALGATFSQTDQQA